MGGARLFCLLLAMLAAPGWAVIETYEFETEELRERYQVLTQELRCPKCQNQNIADSNAPIARDLRERLHEQLHAGRSDAEISDYMVQRYGDFALYRPRFSGRTAVLWVAPAVLLLLGAFMIARIVRRRMALPIDDETETE